MKVLVVGNSGAGKTALLGTLARDGYQVFLADFDSGADILDDPMICPEEVRKNIHIKTFYDEMNLQLMQLTGKLEPIVHAATDFSQAMGKWLEDGKNLGNLYSWKDREVFVIDSLAFAGNAFLNRVLQLNSSLSKRPTFPQIGTAMDELEAILETVYNPSVKCNIVVFAHISAQTDDLTNATKHFPLSLGKKLNPKIARYFNNVLLIKKEGEGENIIRQLHTAGTMQFDCKTTRPSVVPAIMPPDLGLFFSYLKGEKKPEEKKAKPTNVQTTNVQTTSVQPTSVQPNIVPLKG